MNLRRFSSLTLVLMLAATIGFTILVAFLLSTTVQRTPQFWITLSVITFCEIISFGFALSFNASGGESRHPVPSSFGIGTTIAIYDICALLVCVLFWLIHPVSVKWYVILHLGTLLGLVLLGGVATIFLHASTKGEGTDKTNRAVMFGLQAMVADALHDLAASSSAPSLAQISQLLVQLQEMIRFSDPNSPAGLFAADEDVRQSVVACVRDVKVVVGSPSEDLQRSLDRAIRDAMHKLKQRNSLITQLK